MPAATTEERLASSVQYLKGVGPARAALLERVGVRTLRDLLFYFPRDYRDLTDLRPIAELEPGKLQTVRGEVIDVDARPISRGRSLVGVLIRDRAGRLGGVWFNQPYMREKFKKGQQVLFSGKAHRRTGRWEMAHPRVQWLDDDAQEDLLEATAATSVPLPFLPVYGLTEGLRQHEVRRIVQNALDEDAVELVEEVLPIALRAAKQLPGVAAALRSVHFPRTREELERARCRFAYQEALLLQLGLEVKRRQRREMRRAPELPATTRIDARIRRLFPFKLTAAQERAIGEIAADLASGRPMLRLLQGDVGSGKTAVAVYAMLTAIAHAHQAALMAPTEVLAGQHWTTLERYLAHSRVRRVLLTGALGSAARAATLAKIAAGEIDLVVGTQALIQQDVEFRRLGVAVIDEQHRFGVRQRARFRNAASAVEGASERLPTRQGGGSTVDRVPEPHVLVMTATPIPRTIAMTLYGDLDVSVLNEVPPGRQKVNTYLVGTDRRAAAWEFVRKKLAEGRQAYVVCPLVEESEALDVQSAEATYRRLLEGELRGRRLGLVHGRMARDEKERAMREFAEGQTQALVSTTVIEVGIDVPNATLMVVLDAERFGLAQLHQLRGRIVRGRHAGHCFLFAEPKTEDARERLEALVRETDGFKIAELDFYLRGPGEIFGTRQHGGELITAPHTEQGLEGAEDPSSNAVSGGHALDLKLLDLARRDAAALLDADPALRRPDLGALRAAMLNRYGKALDLAEVG